VLQLTRTGTARKTGTRHTEVVYTSMSVTDAAPAQIAGWLRGHWAIENRLHWVRDVTFAEDHSQVRTKNGPQVMATLRNTVIGLLRLDGHANIP
jgi:predicted transposase YbfD/YdcC